MYVDIAVSTILKIIQLAKLDRVADAVVITTQDRMHAEPAIAFGTYYYTIH